MHHAYGSMHRTFSFEKKTNTHHSVLLFNSIHNENIMRFAQEVAGVLSRKL